MQLLDGQKVSAYIQEKINIPGGIRLAVILVGESPASLSYVKKKRDKCRELGISVDVYNFNKDISQQELINHVNALNDDGTVTGILVQLPLPENIDSRQVLDSISIHKDVDGLNSYNLAQVFLGREKIIPCAPKGVLTLLDHYEISLASKNICMIGYSDLIGKPLSALCSNRGATVTVCHTKTSDLKTHTKNADIIISATGSPGLIKHHMVKHGVVVIDMGFTRKDKAISGDVDFENVKDKCTYITPVPGGVGPMTIISLVENLVQLKSAYSTGGGQFSIDNI